MSDSAQAPFVRRQTSPGTTVGPGCRIILDEYDQGNHLIPKPTGKSPTEFCYEQYKSIETEQGNALSGSGEFVYVAGCNGLYAQIVQGHKAGD
ncbi:MAG: hypothetical protein IT464_02880 [Planctomycetes bacterium]|nr:hypothetical protein [Planctomycetota bacterium]